MRKYIYCILLLLLASLGMVSCTEHEFGGADNGQYIRITTSCVNLGATRAEGDAEPTTMPGVNDLNENLIQTIHYFLYPKGGTDANAVLKGKITNIREKDGSATIDIPLVVDVLNNDLFPGTNRECEVYLIANFSGTTDLENLEDTRLETLKAIAIEDFYNGNVVDGVRSLATYQKQESFVMDGQGKVTLEDRTQQVVNAEDDLITLKRFAAKYTVCVSTENFIEEVKDADGNITAEKVWTPVLSSMKVRVENVVSNSTLAGTFGTDLFDYEARTKNDVTKDVDAKTYQMFNPFYSYPCQWQIHEDNALAMYIELSWVHDEGDGTSDETKCLYKVIPNTTQLNRNTWYNIDLNIGVLSINPEEVNQVINIEGTCTIEDWNNGNSDWEFGYQIDSEIKGARYLIVEQNEYVVNNKNEFEIPFISSHKCEITGWTVKNKIYDSSKQTLVDKTITSDESKNWLTLEGNTIKLNHTLNNNFLSETDKSYDCTPYVFTIKLRHAEDEFENQFCETITIIQKPALCITAELNSGTGNTYHGYQFVNGYHAVNTSTYTYGGAVGLTGATTDPYMYVIEVSVLPDGSDFILGDPRSITSTTNDNRLDLDFEHFEDEAPGVEGSTSRKLTNYYGTPKMDASVENMIAPKIRFASSHSTVNSSITYANAYNRAATYQEDGFPAGRWRVPTWAEMRFVAKLCSDQKMGQLLSNIVGYWCVNGLVTATITNNRTTVTLNPSTNATATIRSVRSVYDEWYWEHSDVYRLPEGSRNVFTWGDEGVPAPTTNN